jgi:hypothetical protein
VVFNTKERGIKNMTAYMTAISFSTVAATLSGALVLALGIKMAFKGYQWVSKVIAKA